MAGAPASRWRSSAPASCWGSAAQAVEYRRELKLGGHPIEISLQGPLVRKNKRTAGATVEIRF